MHYLWPESYRESCWSLIAAHRGAKSSGCRHLGPPGGGAAGAADAPGDAARATPCRRSCRRLRCVYYRLGCLLGVAVARPLSRQPSAAALVALRGRDRVACGLSYLVPGVACRCILVLAVSWALPWSGLSAGSQQLQRSVPCFLARVRIPIRPSAEDLSGSYARRRCKEWRVVHPTWILAPPAASDAFGPVFPGESTKYSAFSRGYSRVPTLLLARLLGVAAPRPLSSQPSAPSWLASWVLSCTALLQSASSWLVSWV